MKYTYTIQYIDAQKSEYNIENAVLQYLTAKSMNPDITPEEAGVYDMTYKKPIGGLFMSDDSQVADLQLTPNTIILHNKSYIQCKSLNDLGSFLNFTTPADEGYLGEWGETVDNTAQIYYTIIDTEIVPIFICKPVNVMKLTNTISVQYVIKKKCPNGNIYGMYDCIPEEGDLLFDDFDEAVQELKKIKRNQLKR